MPNILSIRFFIPELILSAASLVLLVLSLFGRRETKDSARFCALPAYLSAASLFAALFFTIAGLNIGTPPLFWGMLLLDRPSIFFKSVFVVTTLFIIMFSNRSNELKSDPFEYYALLLGSVVGMNMLVSSNNLLIIYLSLEFISLISYILVGYTRGSPRSSEAALKYVLYGAVASGVFLYGSSLYYGSTGSLDISLTRNVPLAPLAGIFILAGFLYKTAAVPMHAWCPDAYEGAPTPVAAFLSVAPKAAGFAVLMRVGGSLGLEFNWQAVIAVISAVTMTFGNLAAIPQENVKRLLAYSSIAHAGYLLMGVACFSDKGNEAVYFYFVAYLIMNLGAFLIVQIIGNRLGGEALSLYKGLGRSGACGAALGIAMTIFLLSLTGVPPFIGFIGKFYIFSAVIDARLYWLAMIGIINSVISLYYYMRIVKAMFFDEAAEQTRITADAKSLSFAAALLAFLTVALGIFWQPVSTFVRSISSIS